MQDKQELSKKAKILVISGPSGVGKSTILRLIRQMCRNCDELVTATTRQPRAKEKHGRDYYFLSKEEFLQAVQDGLIPEYRHTKETDNYYGTYLPDLYKKVNESKIIIVDVDIVGAKYFKEHFPNTLTVFINPPSQDELLNRIKKRNDNMSDLELNERLKIAKREMEQDSKFYDYVFVNETGKQKELAQKIYKLMHEFFALSNG